MSDEESERMTYCPRCLHPEHVVVCLVPIRPWSVWVSDPRTTAHACCCVVASPTTAATKTETGA